MKDISTAFNIIKEVKTMQHNPGDRSLSVTSRLDTDCNDFKLQRYQISNKSVLRQSLGSMH